MRCAAESALPGLLAAAGRLVYGHNQGGDGMKKTMWVAAAAAVLCAQTARAQVFTMPYQSTGPADNSIGLYLSDGPGDLAIEGIWRRPMASGDLGLRAGFADLGDGYLLLGVDYKQPLNLQTAPLDLGLTLGAQGAIGDNSGIAGQVGLIVGHTFAETGLSITPFIHPRVAIAAPLDDNGDAEVDVLADIGANFDFSPNLSLRFGVNLGDGPDWGIGLAWRR